jgi:hypothetical protein
MTSPPLSVCVAVEVWYVPLRSVVSPFVSTVLPFALIVPPESVRFLFTVREAFNVQVPAPEKVRL